MGSFGTVALKQILEMLELCAPGHTVTKKPHHYWVRWGEKIFPALPLGDHGEKNPDIPIGHIKKMARTLDILPCAKRHLQQL
jgi:hypothetical protein